MIDSGTIDRIYAAADIVEVVGEFVHLKKRGVNYTGLCPFHNEKTPSFSVSPSKQIYKCFGCGKGGNSVNFIMEQEHLSYTEALKYLAKKYNIEIVEKEQTAEDIERKNLSESLMIVNSYAQKYFSELLTKDQEGVSVGLSYFRERGFKDMVIEKFQLGYSKEKRDDFTTSAIKNGYKTEFLVKTGLTIEKDDYRFDRFHGRVMFPIHSLAGKVIGFGGRVLKKDEKTAKYLNSPESEIYHKSKVLYGLFQAKNEIVRNDKCFLVEGYTDVISMHQCGIENVVASSGTSLTTDQIRLIKRFTNNLTILYDGDNAGIKASFRGIDMVLEEGMNVNVVLFPDGEDPDSFSRKKSITEYIEFIKKNEANFITFKVKILMDEAKNDPIKKSHLITDIVHSISLIPDSISRMVYIKECGKILDVNESVLYQEINKKRKKQYEEKYSKFKQETSQQIEKQVEEVLSNEDAGSCEFQEREVIRILLNHGNKELYASEALPGEPSSDDSVYVAEFIINELEKDELSMLNPVLKKMYEEFREHTLKQEVISEKHFTQHTDPLIRNIAIDLLSATEPLSKIWLKKESFIQTEDMILKKLVPGTISAYKYKRISMMEKEIREELKNISSEDDGETITLLQKKIQMFGLLRNQLAKQLGHRTIA